MNFRDYINQNEFVLMEGALGETEEKFLKNPEILSISLPFLRLYK